MFQLSNTLPNGRFVITTGPHDHWTEYETQVWVSEQKALDIYTRHSSTEQDAINQHNKAIVLEIYHE